MKKLPLILFGALLLLPTIMKAVAGFRISTSFQGVRQFSFNYPQSTLTIQLAITNPTKQELTVMGVYGDILYGSQQVGRIDTQDAVVIAANQTTILELPVVIGSLEAVGVLWNAYIKKLPGQSVRFSGTVEVDNFRLPVNQTFEL